MRNQLSCKYVLSAFLRESKETNPKRVGYLESISKEECTVTTDKSKAIVIDTVEDLKWVLNMAYNMPVFYFGIEVYENDQ